MKLKEIRKQNNLTQKEVANILGLTAPGYGFYESGRTEPSISMLIKLAEYYNISVDYLIGRTNDQSIFTNSIIEEPEILKLYNELLPEQQAQLLGMAKGMLIATGKKIYI